jgi:hypothetical protein
LYKKLLLTLFVLVAGTMYVISAEAATPKETFGKNIVYGGNSEDTTLGHRWTMLNTALTESANTNYYWAQKNLGEAHQIYTDYFKKAALEVDPESDQIIEDVFSYNSNYAKTRQLVDMGFNRQVIDNTINTIVYMKIEKALDEGDVDSFLEWYSVIETKFGISKNTALKTNQALVEIKENPDKIHYHQNTIKSEIQTLFKNKIVGEVRKAVTAAGAGKTNDAITATYVGYYQYRAVHLDLVNAIGQEDAEKIESSMKQAMDIARSGASSTVMKSDLSKVLKTVEPVSASFLFKNDDWRDWWHQNSITTEEPARFNNYVGKY